MIPRALSFALPRPDPQVVHSIQLHSATALAFIGTAALAVMIGLAADLIALTVLGLVVVVTLTGTLLVVRAGYPYQASAIGRLLIVLVAQVGVLASGRIDPAPLIFAIVLVHAAATATMSATMMLSGIVLATMGSWYWLVGHAGVPDTDPGLITLNLVLLLLVISGALTGIRLRDRGVSLLGQSRHQAEALAVSLSIANTELARVNADLEVRVADRTRELERSLSTQQALVRELGELAQRDALTGLWNRRALEHALWQPELQARPHCLLIADLDYFKGVNDTFGHLAGDAALRAVAEALTTHLRDGDTVSRIGGEEFAVLLPATALATAHVVAERLRQAVQSLQVPELGDYRLTMSIGLAGCGGARCQLHPTAADHREELLAAADLALYQAKAQGRNQVVLPAEQITPRAPQRGS